MGFHQRYVFVRGGVKDDVRTVPLKQRLHPRRVRHVPNANPNVDVGGQTPQLSFQEELAILRTVDQDQALGRKLQQLPADLRADAPGTARDQQHAIVDPAVQLRHVQPDRLAAEQILDRDLPRTQIDGATQQLLVARQDPHVDLSLARHIDQLANLLACELAGRDEHVRNVVFLSQFARFAQVSDHRYAPDVRVDGLAVLGDEPHHPVVQSGIPPDGAQQGFARIVGSDNQGRRLPLSKPVR